MEEVCFEVIIDGDFGVFYEGEGVVVDVVVFVDDVCE